MNLALGAIVLIILLYPGILARYAYLSGPYSSKNFTSSLIDEFILSLIPAILIQLLAYGFTITVLKKDVHLDLIYKLVIGPFPAQSNPEAVKSINQVDFKIIKENVGSFAIYFSLISILSYGLGRVFRWIVARSFIYNKNQALRLNNEWWDIFSARVLGRARYKEIKALLKRGDADLIVTVSALVNVKDTCYLYFGKLEEYYFLDNKLDRICLSNVYRRKLSDDKNLGTDPSHPAISPDIQEPNGKADDSIESIRRDLDKRYYKLPGTIFIIRYDEVVNMDVEYVLISKTPQD